MTTMTKTAPSSKAEEFRDRLVAIFEEIRGHYAGTTTAGIVAARSGDFEPLRQLEADADCICDVHGALTVEKTDDAAFNCLVYTLTDSWDTCHVLEELDPEIVDRRRRMAEELVAEGRATSEEIDGWQREEELARPAMLAEVFARHGLS